VSFRNRLASLLHYLAATRVLTMGASESQKLGKGISGYKVTLVFIARPNLRSPLIP
jgi:hypothetical protein